MTFREILTTMNRWFLELEWEKRDMDPHFVAAVRELICAAEAGRIIEVPLTGDGATVELPELDTVQMPRIERHE